MAHKETSKKRIKKEWPREIRKKRKTVQGHRKLIGKKEGEEGQSNSLSIE